MHKYTDKCTQMHKYTNTKIHKYMYVYKYTNTHINKYKCTNILINKYTVSQINKPQILMCAQIHTKIQKWASQKFTKTQIQKYTKTQVHKYTKYLYEDKFIHKLPTKNVQMPMYNRYIYKYIYTQMYK